MNREIGFNVMLPPGYNQNPGKRYPVVYFLHGKGGTEASLGLMKQMMAVYHQEDLHDVIWVFPNGGQFSGYHDKKPGSMMAETWILREFIPYIDATYRTLAQPESRGLAGWSMGGGAALLWTASMPDRFCCAATLSAAVKSSQKELAREIVLNADQLRRESAFWLAVGGKEGLLKSNEQLTQQMELLSLNYQYNVLPGVGHDFGPIRNAYYRQIMTFFDQHLQYDPVPAKPQRTPEVDGAAAP
ncbi:MAG: alpha/beta hydrolase-fold protein [Proteobacteria bacterium]|nr:alpha/beta hydrolase-fold protein [Pseudomonadota bacterium]